MYNSEKWSSIIANSSVLNHQGVFRQNERLMCGIGAQDRLGKKSNISMFFLSAITLWAFNFFSWFIVRKLLSSCTVLYCFRILSGVFSYSKLLYDLVQKILRTSITTTKVLKYFWPFFNIMHERVSKCYRSIFKSLSNMHAVVEAVSYFHKKNP